MEKSRLTNSPFRFEGETVDMMKRMCMYSSDENGFVMGYDEAYNLIKETYFGLVKIMEDCKITN